MTEQTIILSHYQARPLLEKRGELGLRLKTSTDLGLTSQQAVTAAHGVELENGTVIAWAVLEEVAASENSCFRIEGGEALKILVFSPETDRVYSLMPTSGAPTMLISGIPMHRIKGTDPYRDTVAKVAAIKPVTGYVLDTATGLGYTAIEAAMSAQRVDTIELDPAALEVARQNPWSRRLFDSANIVQHIGDAFDVIAEFADGEFDRILHDPPTFSLAGDLYSKDFYAEMYRVLKRGGRAFHYIGDPESKSGRTITNGVLNRLQQVGFRRVARYPRGFGVIAYK